MSIWKYKKINNEVSDESRININPGNTPIEYITLDETEVVIKREDKNPNESFKDRSLDFQISKYLSLGIKKFVISSSGNAAVSAAACCNERGLDLDIFVSNSIPEDKLDRIRNFEIGNIKIHMSHRAKSDAIKFAKENNAQNLRGSVDDYAITGFKTIAYELYEQDKDIDAIFIPCSSGTSSVGIYEGYKDLNVTVPQIHIVQTSRIHPIAKEFDKNFEKSESSIALAISDRVAHRKNNVINLIKETKGFGWIVADYEIEESIYKGIPDNTSPNSNLALAGFLKAKQKGFNFRKPCLIFSGL